MLSIVVVFNYSACCPYPEGRHVLVFKAGLLTYSLPNGLPVLVVGQWHGVFGMFQSSQLRV